MELEQVPEAFQSRLRLMVVSALIMGRKSFAELKSITQATDGNLSVQIARLEGWGYVTVEKAFVGRRPQTTCTLTAQGRAAFREYVELLSRIVEQAAEQYRPRAEEKGVRLTVTSAEGQAFFDPKWTEEALCNLLDNAVKYTPAGGSVTVEVQNYELFSAIRVSDTGPGLSEGEQAKVFGRFYRSREAWDQEGVGIGLYLTRQIAEKQGGYVKVESAPGKGSAFSLFLPRP